MIIQRYDEKLTDQSYRGEGILRSFSASPKFGDLFFLPVTECMYCKNRTILVHSSSFHPSNGMSLRRRNSFSRDYRDLEIWACRSCGWWTAKEMELSHYRDRINSTIKRHFGILRKFESATLDTPLQVINDEVAKNPQVLLETHPRRMEELVKYVFESYYACEVRHVGKSHDGGIDLLIIDGDNPIPVQVKRRGPGKESEAVAPVREFLGAMTHHQMRRGIFVTTAPKFSTPAIQLTEDVLKNRQVEQFDLINFDQFVGIFNTVKTDTSYPWKKLGLKGYESVKVNVKNVWAT